MIAYPTEYCFGLGCDPRQTAAVQKLLSIKQRQAQQGVILIAANLQQVRLYAELDGLDRLEQIEASWPGPNTWLLPARAQVSAWIKGKHSSVAMRIPKHDFCLAMCEQFGHPIVSTSANRHGQPALLNDQAVNADFGENIDYIVPALVGGAAHASTITDGITGAVLR